ncbi:MAG: restriction endonuclease subunit S [Acidobacteriota bacterium]
MKRSTTRLGASRGLMNALVETEIGLLPETWPVQRLGDVFETQLGKMLSQKAHGGNAPKPYVRNKNVQWGSIDTSDMLEMDFSEREKVKFQLRRGDLLVCEGGVPGRSAIWNGAIKECYYQKALHRLRPRSGSMINQFMLHWLRFAFDLQNLYGVAGASSTIAHLPEAQLKALRNSLATFLRDILGLESSDKVRLTDVETLEAGVMPFYDRQRAGANAATVVIVDLSLLALEVLENVTALIGRLIHEFLQRLSEHTISGVGRGEFPVVLVLEEAQNYIRENRKSEDDSISKQVFERIAREGRKYGLGLVVASQRPSELSKTVLSQCNSFIVHRLQNPEDLRYFREIVPGIYGQLLDQLPALAPQTALVLGECVQAPALVEMREADPVPRSKNPQFYKSWTCEVAVPNVEAVCAKWEGAGSPEDAEEAEQD